ncbi:hypothetical protein CNBC2130 [Cryptococcus deneoformans B-3501A]|uniref:Endoplasmic reticulum protein, putative n=1 Tax=Cryptococcus deneoformans (strain JEC21 / ATCC MYA-565) TaxID=214684 RepID=Q5KJX4_CRYD1|nr:endoplasmic reticulum protein, putative [Cryptococcus neoformans var. neoformans JEC21]XP_776722.1 hypothetical protein CNBC2130 [Cryptococcus neoformans var. neoformans B-3501A]AAW42492.1 endoplasmic reticulum protein, putative [Cryptococcus neoformans var. neoformans JEC21]EAL22075.1 hypothetical protein CNBC2130 [Cryptococcus neoformans var. neoformans B-3501A]
MSFARTFAQRSLRTLASSARLRAPLPAKRAFSTAQPLRMVVSQARYDAANRKPSQWAKDPIVTYEELKPITQQPTDNILLVDVREPDEVALGSIPSAVNLPLSKLKEALDSHSNPGDFQREFAFPKPQPEQNIIFFCRSGRRSASAAEIANDKGYKSVRNYVGSWLDWSKRESQDKDED